MTRRLFRLPIVVLLVLAVGLLAGGFIVFLGSARAVYPPAGTFSFVPGPSSKYVLASPGGHYDRGEIGQFFLGEHYRFLWTTPVVLPAISLTERNLKIAKKGGGMQTTSFTLVGPDGQEFLLRSVDKDTKGVLPPALHNTLITSFVRDQVSATDPYALLIVSELAGHVGIYQAQPQVVYILPGDTAFKKYGPIQGFYMLYPKEIEELKPAANEIYLASFSTQEMLTISQKPRPTLTLDTIAYLECRLFDLLISDWDRHPGQWDWLAFTTQTDTVFRPAPKDRDQAMGFYEDGVLPWLLTRPFAVRKITSFTHEYQDMKGALENGSVLDKVILKNIPEGKFISIAKGLKHKLPDRAIKAALTKYPPEVRAKIAPLVYSKLVSRRNKLPEAAKGFYEVLHEK